MKEKRVCVCRSEIESEPDQQSVAHALRVHYATEEHQEHVAAAELAEASTAAIDVPIRNGWAGVTASLTRIQ